MRNFFLFVLVSFGLSVEGCTATSWALLVAGSKGWYSYRHQAEILQAYQILKYQHVPEENIILMHYDDIAVNAQNPTPGQVLTSSSGLNVYENAPKDYTGKDITPENLMNILTGNKTAMAGVGSGKVIDSTSKDTVLVYFAGHGGQAVLAFPNSQITVQGFKQLLEKMHEEKRYAKVMLLLFEASFSASMLRNTRLNDMNIFALTSSDFKESSQACNFDETRATYLMDCFSSNLLSLWSNNNGNMSLDSIYDAVKERTTSSTVVKFDNSSLGSQLLSSFIGENISPGTGHEIKPHHMDQNAVKSEDVPVHILEHKTASNQSKDYAAYDQLLEKRSYIQDIYQKVVDDLANSDFQKRYWMQVGIDKIHNWACHTDIVDQFSKICFNFGENPYALKFVHALAHICNEGVSRSKIIDTFRRVCQEGKNVEAQ
uniref:Legumain n=1 Tax=Romanomermis culicivorax TaxID=13658 RepID=A0A915J5D8_ROMCU